MCDRLWSHSFSNRKEKEWLAVVFALVVDGDKRENNAGCYCME